MVAEILESLFGDCVDKVLVWIKLRRVDTRNCLYAQGQPQWRRKAMTVGLPFGFGIGSFEEDGAFAPTSGAGEVVMAFGLIHERSSCWNVIAADCTLKDSQSVGYHLRARSPFGLGGR